MSRSSSARSWLAVLQLLALLAVTSRVEAAERVAVSYADPALRAVAERLASELASDDHQVELRPAPDGPCEDLTEGGPEAALSVGFDPGDPSGVVAQICLRLPGSPVQRGRARGSWREPERFALVTAEALNGLRAQALPRRVARAPQAPPPSPPAQSPPRSQLTLAQTMLLDPSLPVLWGLSLGAELPVTPALRVTLDAFAPVTAAELENERARVRTRTAWLRAGISLGFAVGDARLSAAWLVGPALTWASAEARPPLIGAADSKPSAVTTLAATIQYPRSSRIFLVGTARLSAFFPAVRIAVAGDDTHTLGPLTSELSLGVGLGF